MQSCQVQRSIYLWRHAFILSMMMCLVGCDAFSARSLARDAHELFLEGNRDVEVAKLYEEALQMSPDLASLHYNAGLTYHRLFAPGDLSEDNVAWGNAAEKHFEYYLAQYPEDNDITKLLINTYIGQGNYDSAVAYWAAVTEKEPNNTEAWLSLAGINEEAGRFDEAVRCHYKRYDIATAAAARTEQVNALYAIGSLQYRRLLADKSIREALRLDIADNGMDALNEALILDPDNEGLEGLIKSLYEQRAFAYHTSWASMIEQGSALVHRARWQTLYKKRLRGIASSDDAQPSTETNPDATTETMPSELTTDTNTQPDSVTKSPKNKTNESQPNI